MTPTTTITGFIDSSDKKITLGTEVWIDNICVVNVEHVDRIVHFSHVLEEDNAEHELRIVMKHKTPDHTELDDAGNIIRDAMLSISDIKFDEIALGQVFGDLGCNGTVSLKFTAPTYLWLLENM